MLEIGSNILLYNLFSKSGGFVKDICKAQFAKAVNLTAQINSQLKRSFCRLLEWQQHWALLSQLAYCGSYVLEMFLLSSGESGTFILPLSSFS